MTPPQPEALAYTYGEHHEQDIRLIRDYCRMASISLLACFHDPCNETDGLLQLQAAMGPGISNIFTTNWPPQHLTEGQTSNLEKTLTAHGATIVHLRRGEAATSKGTHS